MARTATKTIAPTDLVDVTPQAHQNLATLQDQATAQHIQASRALQTIGYDLPYDRDRVVQETRFYMAQSAEAMLEAGRRLIAIKENEPHGEFMEVIQHDLGLNERTARVMMQASAKYLLNPALAPKRQALAVLGKTKLFELMVEPDDDLAALVDGGTLAGKTFDEIDSMTSRELKAALRESKEESKAKDKLLEEKNKRIDKLQAAQQRIQTAPPDQVLADLKSEATSMASEAEGVIIGRLRHALVALNNHGDERGLQDVFMAGLIGQVQHQLNSLREQFGLPDTAAAADAPAWAQWADAQDGNATDDGGKSH